MINIKHLNLIRSNRFLLKDINLEINKGIHTVVGPNGAGKTTLLRSISGVFSDYQGSIQYFGKEIKDYSGSELAKNRAFASQFFDVAFPFTVKEDSLGKPLIEVEYKDERREFHPEEISSMVLVKMKETASQFLGEVTDSQKRRF